MRYRIRNLVHHGLVSNVVSLYGVQIAKYLLPLITVPYLTRVLGPPSWGLVALAQAYGAYLSLPVNYGFNFSGTREIARIKNDSEQRSIIFAGVTGAKCILGAACILISIGVGRWVPIFRTRPLLLWMGVLAALVTCFAPIWYFMGIEELKLVASLDIIGRIVATAGIFVVIRRPDDAWKVLAVQAAGGTVSLVAGTWIVYRNITFRIPAWRSIWEALAAGRSMFVSSSAIGLYTSGNAFILGLFAPPSIVGYYAGGEKLVRAALQLFSPPYQTLFPRISNLIHRDIVKAKKLARLSLAFFVATGLAAGLIIFISAPWLVKIILGKGFESSIPVVRLLSLLLPLVALNTALGGLWMVPLRMDRAVEILTLIAGAINIGLAVALAPRFTGLGVASAVVLAETFVMLAFFIFLIRKKMAFWRGFHAGGA